MTTPRQILIVEDEPGQAAMLDTMIRDIVPPGTEVNHAADLGHAIQMARSTDYASICLDLNLPDSHGARTYLLLRGSTAGNIVVYTGDTRAAQITKSSLQNSDVVIEKPNTSDAVDQIAIQVVAGAFLKDAG
jgi:DNA-binding response OmpR family regulator